MESQHFTASRLGRLLVFLLATVVLASLWPEADDTADAAVDLAARASIGGGINGGISGGPAQQR
jgi:hypothetical protein